MDTKTQILDSAERAMRVRGYHAVSFRDLADELGIKSASIHYHFRHKHDLGSAVVQRYSDRVAAAVGDARGHDWPSGVAVFCEVYVNAIKGEGLQCLCSMLSAESRGLPDEVAVPVAEFFEANLAWLRAAGGSEIQALRVQAEVQGAMTLAVSLQNEHVLERLAAQICADAETPKA
ncbi:TetR/AcrR family transcriptional regulator [Pelagimonas varians]|uniref:DNA-binding transcriptional repressor AcrR n=1 Tax=Pelagimonas varians TaxID=696760 RepID=A0A238KDM5_9RHOB|nr:TetR/AcrR family transcriptional regulator [Pelagimonas varians]PYG29868.1 TetR family transcriptional regulator [Pelagimonas varians]SMX40931.1 DNA-binding transcriptional repressor AcrR [Pelagimonas varians]